LALKPFNPVSRAITATGTLTSLGTKSGAVAAGSFCFYIFRVYSLLSLEDSVVFK
jgi:hypothetical protein